MAEALQFPDFTERSWPENAAAVRAAALASGWSPSAANWICDDLKPRFKTALVGIREKLSALEQAQEGVSEQSRQFANQTAEIYREAIKQFWGQLFVMEFELWLAKFGQWPEIDQI
jgi:hypothetical protein